MMNILAILLFLIFFLLSSIHFYWSFGGHWGKSAAVPTNSNNIKVFQPSFLPTLIVALGMLSLSLFTLIRTGVLDFELPNWLNVYGLWIIAAVFISRTIGDFKYIGFFKKIRQTKFGQNDTKYYSPLCLIITILAILIALT